MTYPLPKFIPHRVGYAKVIWCWRFITPLFNLTRTTRHWLTLFVEWYSGKDFGDKERNKEIDK